MSQDGNNRDRLVVIIREGNILEEVTTVAESMMMFRLMLIHSRHVSVTGVYGRLARYLGGMLFGFRSDEKCVSQRQWDKLISNLAA